MLSLRKMTALEAPQDLYKEMHFFTNRTDTTSVIAEDQTRPHYHIHTPLLSSKFPQHSSTHTSTLPTSNMKTALLSTALTLLATQALSLPSAPKAEPRVFEASITFYGADGVSSFTQSFPTDNSQVAISKSACHRAFFFSFWG